MSRTQNLNNREFYYHNQMAALAQADLPAQAQALGGTVDEQGRVTVKFFGRDYLVTPGQVEVVGGGPTTMDHKSVIAHYLMSQGRGELKGEYVPLGRLTGLVNTGATPSGDLTAPLTERLGDKYEAFARAAGQIGGSYGGRAPSGGESWLFLPLPKLPLQIVFFEADDEFPAEIKVMFDASATAFVSYECLELLEIVLVVELLGAAGLLGCGGGHCGEGGGSCGSGECGGHDQGGGCDCH